MQDLTKTVKDTAYAIVGFGVMGVQKAQVRRVELTKKLEQQLKGLEPQIGEAKAFAAEALKAIDERVEPVIDELGDRLDDIEGKLPEPAKDLFHQAREVAKDARDQVRSRLVPATPAKTTKAKATKTAKSARTKAKTAA
jgi:hypothetical protein